MWENHIPDGAVLFSVACPEIALELTRALEQRNRFDVALDLKNVYVVSRIEGPRDEISFGAYAIPALTYEERVATPIRDWEEVEIPLRGGVVTFSLDDFGKINYLQFKALPEVYAALKAANIPTDEEFPPHIKERVEAERIRLKEEAHRIKEKSDASKKS